MDGSNNSRPRSSLPIAKNREPLPVIPFLTERGVAWSLHLVYFTDRHYNPTDEFRIA